MSTCHSEMPLAGKRLSLHFVRANAFTDVMGDSGGLSRQGPLDPGTPPQINLKRSYAVGADAPNPEQHTAT